VSCPVREYKCGSVDGMYRTADCSISKSVTVFLCAACSPEFRFSDHIETAVLDVEQPKKMLLKRDPDSYEVCDQHSPSVS